MWGIFGKPLKRAFQTCMGHGGVGVNQQKLFGRQRGRFRDFGPFSGISEVRDTILTRFGSHFQVFGLDLAIGSNQDQKWIQHPQNRGIPCFQPLGQPKWVPRAENMISPYFECAESISGLGLTQFQGFK